MPALPGDGLANKMQDSCQSSIWGRLVVPRLEQQFMVGTIQGTSVLQLCWPIIILKGLPFAHKLESICGKTELSTNNIFQLSYLHQIFTCHQVQAYGTIR